MKSKKATVSTGTFVRKHIKALLVGGGLLIVAGILFAQFIFPWIQMTYLFAKMEHETHVNNPAKKLASSMLPFAKEHHLKKIYEYNGAADGFDNTIPSFIYIFQSSDSIDSLYVQLKTYLETEGYKMRDTLYTYDPRCTFEDCESYEFAGGTVNENQPYRVFRGKNDHNDTLYGEISNRTYSPDGDDEIGEHKVEAGQSVLNITFRSHECLGGCLETESTE